MVLIEQISALIDFLENHQDLALGYCSRTNEGRSLSKRYWMECAQILNSISVDCPNKTPAEWRTFYNEYKSKTLKKIKSQKSEISATAWNRKIWVSHLPPTSLWVSHLPPTSLWVSHLPPTSLWVSHLPPTGLQSYVVRMRSTQIILFI
ncbi:uncharacterized protein LOC123699987 isoform X2 [Colias croceus]|uniref:uncharacterized protein LOC123699987 isoform X2 n=1 Tax=Colias crocea TaxID=72248 RepID=UPI001E27B19B|nr:uncharacterized protein LOC123699987 isoform X2 [Colias croceus]